MEYQLGKPEQLDDICSLIAAAVKTMENQGILQWDELYPTREDFAEDISKGTLYTVREKDTLIAIYVISTECDSAYLNGKWEYGEKTACILHRLCVSPTVQNQGIGTAVLKHIEKQVKDLGFESIRLDVFSKNPKAMKLYEKNGYQRRGYADWRKGRFWLMEKGIL